MLMRNSVKEGGKGEREREKERAGRGLPVS